MGEPPSFMGLTLYNLAVIEISAHIALRGISPTIKYPVALEVFEKEGPLPSGYQCVVGDDLEQFTNIPGLDKATHRVYASTNAKRSPGKDTTSRCHGVLAENHVWFDGKHLQYLDTIKAKLLTPSTRFHSDNRSSIIGKGSTLYTQLVWYEETMPAKLSFSAQSARLIYTQMCVRGMYPRVMRRALGLPIALPPSVGGISFPLRWDSVQSLHREELNFLYWLIHKSPLDKFIEFSTKLKCINRAPRRSLDVPDYSEIWCRQVKNLLEVNNLKPVESFDPNNREGLYTLKTILSYVVKHVPEVPISPVTGVPQVKLALSYIYDKFGFTPIEAVDDLYERYYTFLSTFKGDGKPATRLTFTKYVSNLNRFWSTVKGTDSLSGFADHEFKNLEALHWDFSQRNKILIHKDYVMQDTLASGPTLRILAGKIGASVRSREGWNSTLDHTICDYLNRLNGAEEESLSWDVLQSFDLGHG
uniref:RNA-dependent RNA polymerase n=1 Tax=Grapevine-associated narna-like virus 14 TaxID=2814328 RepID=A0A8F5RCU3_9VIRU|nr:MAG: RNA-dependent RNA polymerase [Grapevine-associated narna-like virus 14]